MCKSTFSRASLALALFLFTANLASPQNSRFIQPGTNFLSVNHMTGPAEMLLREGATTVEARPGASSAQADWFVIVGSFKNRDDADKRAEYFTNRGYDVNVTSTNEFVNWADDLWAVVMGPYTQKTAKKMMNKVRSFDKNVYIKRGIVGG